LKGDVVAVLLPLRADVVASVADGSSKKVHAVLQEIALWNQMVTQYDEVTLLESLLQFSDRQEMEYCAGRQENGQVDEVNGCQGIQEQENQSMDDHTLGSILQVSVVQIWMQENEDQFRE